MLDGKRRRSLKQKEKKCRTGERGRSGAVLKIFSTVANNDGCEDRSKDELR